MPGNVIDGSNIIFTSRNSTPVIELKSESGKSLSVGGVNLDNGIITTSSLYTSTIFSDTLTISANTVDIDTDNLVVTDISMPTITPSSTSNFQLHGVGANAIEVGKTSNPGTLLISGNDTYLSEIYLGSEMRFENTGPIEMIADGPVNVTCNVLNITGALNANGGVAISGGILTSAGTISNLESDYIFSDNIEFDTLSGYDVDVDTLNTAQITCTRGIFTGITTGRLDVTGSAAVSVATIGDIRITGNSILNSTTVTSLTASVMSASDLMITGSSILGLTTISALKNTTITTNEMRVSTGITTVGLNVTGSSVLGVSTIGNLLASSVRCTDVSTSAVNASGTSNFNNVNVLGTLTATVPSVLSDTTLAHLSVTGTSRLGIATATTLNVTGITTGTLVTTSMTSGSISVSGSSFLTGALTASNNQNFLGNSTISALNVTGVSTLQSTFIPKKGTASPTTGSLIIGDDIAMVTSGNAAKLSIGNSVNGGVSEILIGQPNNYGLFINWISNTTAPTSVVPQIGTYGATNALVLQPSGNNVGIGISPSFPLHVNGAIASTSLTTGTLNVSGTSKLQSSTVLNLQVGSTSGQGTLSIADGSITKGVGNGFFFNSAISASALDISGASHLQSTTVAAFKSTGTTNLGDFGNPITVNLFGTLTTLGTHQLIGATTMTHLKVDSSLTAPSSFIQAQMTTGVLSHSGGGYYSVIWSTSAFHPSTGGGFTTSSFSNSNTRVTPPYNGVYSISFWCGTPDADMLMISRNSQGTNILNIANQNISTTGILGLCQNPQASLSWTGPLTTSDYIAFCVYRSAATPTINADRTGFSMCLLYRT